MQPLQLLSQMPGEMVSVLLVLLLIAVLVAAYKLMEMVFETLAVATLSAFYYTGLTYLFTNMSGFEINEMLLFVFLGAALYLLYSFLYTVATTASAFVGIPLKIVKTVGSSIHTAVEKASEKAEEASKERKKKKKTQRKQEENDSEENKQSTKEVVLDKVKEEGETD
ncbi:MAG: hypothetical protein ABEJ93_02700 [Candidatus Nanohalobium sp.]